MDNTNDITKGTLNGSLLNESGYAVQKQAVEDANTLKDGGVLGEINIAARNSALGTLGVTIGNKLLIHNAELPEDPQFKQGLFERIRTDLPDVTDTEQAQLMGAGNIHEYNLLMDTAKRRRTDQRLGAQSGLATGLTMAFDVLPEVAAGVRLSGALAGIESVATRTALAVGGNTVMGAGFEAARQRMALQNTNGDEVAQSALLSGAIGGLFDSGIQYGKYASKARKIARDKVAELVNGGKPTAEVVAEDVAKQADNVAADAAKTDAAATKQADTVVADTAKAVDSPVLKEITQEITDTAPKQVEALDALLTASRKIVAEDAGPMQKAFLDFQEKAAAKEEAYWAKHQADGQKWLDARLAQDAANREAAAAVKAQEAQAARAATTPEEAARIQQVMKDLENTPVKTQAEQAWATDVSPAGIDPKITSAEQLAAKTMTEGRLRLKVGDLHKKPHFESPIDRALATLGSKVADDGLMLDALDTLKKAFPGEDNDTLVNMAHDYVDSMLMPHLRTTKGGAPNVGRWWDKLDAAKYRDGYEESVKELNAALKPLTDNNGPATAELIARHVDDADGAILSDSVSRANKYVTNQTMGSGFKFLQKSNKVLADTVNERIAAYTAETGAAPDLRTVRTWMAKELYGRKMFNLQAEAAAAAKKAATVEAQAAAEASKASRAMELSKADDEAAKAWEAYKKLSEPHTRLMREEAYHSAQASELEARLSSKPAPSAKEKAALTKALEAAKTKAAELSTARAAMDSEVNAASKAFQEATRKVRELKQGGQVTKVAEAAKAAEVKPVTADTTAVSKQKELHKQIQDYVAKGGDSHPVSPMDGGTVDDIKWSLGLAKLQAEHADEVVKAASGDAKWSAQQAAFAKDEVWRLETSLKLAAAGEKNLYVPPIDGMSKADRARIGAVTDIPKSSATSEWRAKFAKPRSKQAGFIAPKMVFVLAGGAALTLAMTPDANAATGASATSGALQAILSGGMLLVGGKALKKVLASKGMLTKEVEKGLEKAKLLKSQGADAQFIQDATKFKEVGGEWHYAMEPEKFPELADEAALTSEHLDEVVSKAEGFKLNGEPLKVLMHYDAEKVINSVEDLSKNPHIKAEVEVFGKKVYAKTPDVVSADATVVARDQSAVARGLGMMFMSNIVPRLGRKAMEVASDQLYKSIKVEALGRMDISFKKNFDAWFAETGAKKPFAPWKMALEQKKFGEAIALAKEFPDAPGVSKAAKAAADDMAKIEAEMVGRLKNLVTEMQAKGVVFTENNPLYKASKIDPKADYVSRLVSKEKMNAVEAQIGREGVHSLIKEAFGSANSGIPKDKLDEIAASIYESLVRIHDNTGVFIPKDQAANFILKLKAAGLDDETIATVGQTFGIRESGKGPSLLKARRMNIDLNASKTFTVDGKQVTVRMSDLYERDAMALFGRWTNSMAGLEAVGTAGAYHGINLTDESVWNMLVAKANSQGADVKTIQALNAYRNMMLGYGRDKEFFGVASSFERTVRTMTTFWLGSNFALAQAGDIGGMGTGALKNLFKGIKVAYELRKGIKDGTIAKSELASMASWLNLGLDSVSASTANMAEGMSDVGANLSEKALQIQMRLNGMHFMANATAAVKGMQIQEFLVQHALGEAVDEKMWKHWATFGLDKAVADELAPFIRKHLVVDPETQVLMGIDKKAWMAEDLLSARRLEMALQKAGHTANSQASGYGETAAFFRSTMAGRFLGQIQSTAMFTTQRSLGEVYNFDSYVMNAWLTSMAFSATSYMARVGMRYANDQEELDKRLTFEQIFLASVRNSAFAGVGPNVIDALVSYSGIKPGGIFNNATNSGRSGGGELALQAAVKTPLTAIAGLTGLAKMDPYDAYTQSEAMALQRTIAPLWWMQPMMTFATKDMTTKNPKRPAEDQ